MSFSDFEKNALGSRAGSVDIYERPEIKCPAFGTSSASVICRLLSVEGSRIRTGAAAGLQLLIPRPLQMFSAIQFCSAASQPRLGVCGLTPIMLIQRRFLVMMPLYYLHIRNGDKLEVDPYGTELPDLDVALAEAVKVARELLDEVDDLGRDAVTEIADGSGETILTVPFSEVVRPH